MKTNFVFLVCSAVLGGVMGYRALNSGKFMPSGLISFIRLVSLSVTSVWSSYFVSKNK